MKKLMLVYKIGFPPVVLSAILVQFFDNEQNAFRIVNFFSFFTIESNVLALVVMFVSGVFLIQKKRSHTFDHIRGAATLYMVITGIVYTLLLSGADVQVNLAWVNNVLHYIFPVVMLFDWLVDRVRPAVSLKKALWWLTFPITYLAYSLVRGPLAHWYPYPFLDPRQHGYLKVAITSVVIAIAGIVLIFLLVKYTQLFKKANRN